MPLQDKKAKYVPDRWVIVDIEYEGQKVVKILSGWSGGYLDGDSWRISSGITKVEENDDAFFVTNETGSTYYLRKTAVGLNIMSGGILNTLTENKIYPVVSYTNLDSITEFLQQFKN